MAAQSQTNSDSSSNPAGSSRFAQDVRQIFADDPDPLFLEESWTLGVPAAVENLHRRRRQRADRESQSRAFREHDSMASLYGASWDTIWPQRTAAQAPPEPAFCNETYDDAMTLPRARLLLEVSPHSTHEQIHSAYRRMVSRWHPDRLQLCTEEIRQYATQRMADLNDAYRLLRTTLQQRAA
jgi:DnaJ-domain-containing protein 1